MLSLASSYMLAFEGFSLEGCMPRVYTLSLEGSPQPRPVVPPTNTVSLVHFGQVAANKTCCAFAN